MKTTKKKILTNCIPAYAQDVCARLLYGLSYNSSFTQLSTKVLRITNDKQKNFYYKYLWRLKLKTRQTKKKKTKILKKKTKQTKKILITKLRSMYTM